MMPKSSDVLYICAGFILHYERHLLVTPLPHTHALPATHPTLDTMNMGMLYCTIVQCKCTTLRTTHGFNGIWQTVQ